jgi:hypothetical protein
MRVWLIFVQGDDATWLEAAWDDESTAANPDGWQHEVNRVRKLAFDSNYEMRTIEADIPGVFDAFEIPKVKGSRA